MANALYTPFKQRLYVAAINLDTDTFKAMLVDNADYTVNITTHDDLADVAAGAREETATMPNPTVITSTNTVGWDTDDFTWTAAAGDPCESIVSYDDTHASDALVFYIDTATGLAVTLNGGDVTCAVHASGWFGIP